MHETAPRPDMNIPTRPRKRTRSTLSSSSSTPSISNFSSKSKWHVHLRALVDRLSLIRSRAQSLADEHLSSVAEIDRRIRMRQTAKRALTKTQTSPKNDPTKPFLKGVKAEKASRRVAKQPKPKLPAVLLLMEADAPEKAIVEQSIVARAQAINRKNAELARERLPKQPEAQRNKTHHDYFMDEVVWMSTDFKEERKHKIHLARKVSKLVVQYHVQRGKRRKQAKLDELKRVKRLAAGVARDVRKFWKQIEEIAEYKTSLEEQRRDVIERETQLKKLVHRTTMFTEKMARRMHATHTESDRRGNCTNSASSKDQQNPELEAGASVDESKGTVHVSITSEKPSIVGTACTSKPDDEAKSPQQPDNDDEASLNDGGDQSSEADSDFSMDEDEGRGSESKQLSGDNDMSVEELLRSQGIDPSAYRSDKRNYLDSHDLGDDDDDDDDAEDEQLSKGRSDVQPTQIVPEDMEERKAGGKENQPEPENRANEDVKSNESTSLNAESPVEGDSNAHRNDETSAIEDATSPKPEEPLDSTAANASTTAAEPPPVPESNSIPDASVTLSTAGKLVSTLSKTPIVSAAPLLRGSLRDYQQAGLEWLASMYSQNMNGILADEMGLGKTIQTISLLAWLAYHKGIWGPHLIIVPTSVMVNWEVEFKKWLPGLKIMTYFGSVKERKLKRTGWTKQNFFHVCITSYKLAVQDSNIFRRRSWYYLILDEAHNIKNFNSQRWQTLLHFNSVRRLLLTGTPLQNSVMELWSLMHFVTPDIFSSHSEFHGWFSKPCIEAAEEQGEHSQERLKIVNDLHKVLRPFMLRRLKAEVEKGLPPKQEHIIKCHLSKRQRQLYEDFISRGDIRETLESRDYFGIFSILMQLRKVCNHPDLFEGRPIVSPFAMAPVFFPIPVSIARMFEPEAGEKLNLRQLRLNLSDSELSYSGSWFVDEAARIGAEQDMRDTLFNLKRSVKKLEDDSSRSEAFLKARRRDADFRCNVLQHMILINTLRLKERAVLGEDLRAVVTMSPSNLVESIRSASHSHAEFLSTRTETLCRTFEHVAIRSAKACDNFTCCITKVRAPVVEMRYQGDDRNHCFLSERARELADLTSMRRSLFRSYDVRSVVTIPDRRLIQWDCGKLQILDRLIRQLRRRGSRALIFTQMTKVLDILESFLSLHSLRYLRLDGTTKADQRQKVVERFNTDKRIFCMILATRAGGVGLNLTGADTVIFYDSDYNPAIDSQAQDRAHRIGQTKPVHIYRMLSEKTVEENIFKRALEKRTLESLVISEAKFTTDAFRKHTDVEPIPSNKQPASAENSTSFKVVSNGRVKPHLAQPEKSKVEHHGLETGNGPFTGFTVAPSSRSNGTINPKSRFDEHKADLAEYEAASSELLAKDDERERAARISEYQEEKEFSAEFQESDDDVEGKPSTKDDLESSLSGYNDLKSSLTPVQRYALRLVEAEYDSSDEESESESSQPATPFVEELGENGKTEVHVESETHEDNEENELEQLHYSVALTPEGQANYLKVLTDTEADINLFLPLRDGGPEELKVSSVVSGTAAAGLECAEDAAFFPHAYNRMSRTPFATRRQREKCAAIQRKRTAERDEARRKKEMEDSSSNVELRQKDKLVGNLVSSRDIAAALARTRTGTDVSTQVGGPSSKRVGTKGKNAMFGASFGSQEVSQAANMGLFKRTTKKSTKRLSLNTAKSAGVLSTGASKEDLIGDNDGWTKGEDQALLNCSSEFGNNMLLAADVLGCDPRVNAGLRRRRSHLHCVGRMIACQGNRSNPAGVKATVSDAEVFLKHKNALRSLITKRKAKPYPWLSLHTSQDIHASHRKAMTQALSKAALRVKAETVPPVEKIIEGFDLPKYHRPGFKTTESTPQAMRKLRYPFSRSSRDDMRFPGRSSVRGSSGRGTGVALHKASNRPSSSADARSQGSRPANNRTDISRTASSAAKSLQGRAAQNVSSTRKPYYTPGTAAKISVGQYPKGVARATVLKGQGSGVKMSNAILRPGVISRPTVAAHKPNGDVQKKVVKATPSANGTVIPTRVIPSQAKKTVSMARVSVSQIAGKASAQAGTSGVVQRPVLAPASFKKPLVVKPVMAKGQVVTKPMVVSKQVPAAKTIVPPMVVPKHPIVPMQTVVPKQVVPKPVAPQHPSTTAKVMNNNARAVSAIGNSAAKPVVVAPRTIVPSNFVPKVVTTQVAGVNRAPAQPPSGRGSNVVPSKAVDGALKRATTAVLNGTSRATAIVPKQGLGDKTAQLVTVQPQSFTQSVVPKQVPTNASNPKDVQQKHNVAMRNIQVTVVGTPSVVKQGTKPVVVAPQPAVVQKPAVVKPQVSAQTKVPQTTPQKLKTAPSAKAAVTGPLTAVANTKPQVGVKTPLRSVGNVSGSKSEAGKSQDSLKKVVADIRPACDGQTGK